MCGDGVQGFPFGGGGENGTIEEILGESSVFYVGGPLDGQLTLFWTMP